MNLIERQDSTVSKEIKNTILKAKKYYDNQLSKNTKKSYKNDLICFDSWCADNNIRFFEDGQNLNFKINMVVKKVQLMQ
jgi:site-specific recombinase XerD